LLNPAAVLMPAANVIMQLASPPVGYGVLESPVDSGNVYKHPLKRSRTTGYYLAAATIGTDADRALVRKEIDKVHALIRSTASSPFAYNAFDPQLQLWVAACLYRPGRVRRILEALARGAADRSAGTGAPLRSCRRGISANAASTAARPAEPLRDDGFPAPGVPHAYAAAVDQRATTVVRAHADRPADRRPRCPPRRLAVLVWPLPAQHADPGAPRQANHLTRLP
jgi:hypothetical protein